jgi:hypothetical protein
MVQLSVTRCICIAILSVSLVSFAAITLCVASQRVFIIVVVVVVVVVVVIMDSVQKLLDTPSYHSFFIKSIGTLPYCGNDSAHCSFLYFRTSSQCQTTSEALWK